MEREENVKDLTLEVLKQIRAEIQGSNVRLDRLADRVDGLTERVEGLTERVEGLTERVEGLTERVDGLTDRVDRLGQRVDALTEEVSIGFRALQQQEQRRFLDHEGRLRRLETHAGFRPPRGSPRSRGRS